MAEAPTPGKWDALAIHGDDDVAVALRDLRPSTVARVRRGDNTALVAVREEIPLGHKFALRAIESGEVVRKYGEAIGEATLAIASGAHVHVHNLRSRRARAAS